MTPLQSSTTASLSSTLAEVKRLAVTGVHRVMMQTRTSSWPRATSLTVDVLLTELFETVKEGRIQPAEAVQDLKLLFELDVLKMVARIPDEHALEVSRTWAGKSSANNGYVDVHTAIWQAIYDAS